MLQCYKSFNEHLTQDFSVINSGNELWIVQNLRTAQAGNQPDIELDVNKWDASRSKFADTKAWPEKGDFSNSLPCTICLVRSVKPHHCQVVLYIVFLSRERSRDCSIRLFHHVYKIPSTYASSRSRENNLAHSRLACQVIRTLFCEKLAWLNYALS